MEEADALMELEAADETKPFDEKYKARDILQNLKTNEYLSDKYTKLRDSAENVSENNSIASVSQGSDIMRCALGLIMHKLGVNFYDAEEPSEAVEYLKKALELMDSLPDTLKLRHLCIVQDLYNYIAIIFADREKSKEALEYLEKSQEIYAIVVEHTKEFPQKTVMTNFDLYLLKQSKSAKDGKEQNFSFYINSGLDLKKMEKKFMTTLFILA